MATKRDYFKEHQDNIRKQLLELGLTNLSEEQYFLINEPSESPESYSCDGEISSGQAYSNWLQKLAKSGLDKEKIKSAIKFNFE